MERETKKRIPLWIYPSTEEQINRIFESDNCKSPSEFIEKAVKFYIGFLNADGNVSYLAPRITSSVDAVIHGSEKRINRNLFKIAVELGKLCHMIAAANEVDDETVRDLHRMCVEEVRRINGVISTESAVKFQQD